MCAAAAEDVGAGAPRAWTGAAADDAVYYVYCPPVASARAPPCVSAHLAALTRPFHANDGWEPP